MPTQRIVIEHGPFEIICRDHPPDTEADCSHCHPGYELYYQQSGSRYLCTDRGTAFLGPGSLALVSRGCAHKTIPVDRAGSRALVVHFTDAYLAPLRRALPGSAFTALFEQGGPVVLASGQDGVVLAILEQLQAQPGVASGDGEACRKLLLAELLLRLRALPHVRPARHGSAETMIQRAKAYVGSHYREPVDLGAIAAWLGVSRSYLSRTFGRVAGMSLAQYINGVRVRAARELLRAPQGAALPIPQIAAQCGFGSTAHFRRVFRETVGITPARYRAMAGGHRGSGHGSMAEE